MYQLRIERQKRNWSLTKVSGFTGITASDLSQIERGIVPVYPSWRRRLAIAFQMSEQKLFTPVDPVDPVDPVAPVGEQENLFTT
jgi:transcriptional regulator with XRE-family HTH domain